MTRYQQIILDVDDTLIDSKKTENYSIKTLFARHNWKLTPELQKAYHTWNQGLWRKLEQGEISYDELSVRTFGDFMRDHMNLEVDGRALINEYRSYFGQCHELLPGARDFLKYAKRQGYQLAVLSNGESFMQHKRLKDAGIEDMFDLIVISDETGSQKPEAAIFDYFFAKSQVAPEKTVFFGDGLKSDILGAENYGFDSIWYNHRHRKDTIGLHPLFEVDTYEEFIKLLQHDFKKTW
ncbi:YjjG family noncanonical pyrimidine nucleotidase [Lactobacillus corticis]|uniref:HAD family hydrolase n=1 Tax=Lactobacillus corticis TaxID=2201249 RepID=A0A916QFX5_9LACO|nr:YjjG family noncanonical pyrimidine nucleotidase [Lactobacillus corticis]GFZ26561.1 HAD family hydrolase [Lactobacillus corticis]